VSIAPIDDIKFCTQGSGHLTRISVSFYILIANMKPKYNILQPNRTPIWTS